MVLRRVLLALGPAALALQVKGPRGTSICNWAQFQDNGQLVTLPLAKAWHEQEDGPNELLSTKVNDSDIFPNFENGAMLGGSNGLVLYGGLTRPTTAKNAPGPRKELGFRLGDIEAGPNDVLTEVFDFSLPENMTRYVSNGASVSVPSENMGYYFSGQHGAHWGPIASDDQSANLSSRSLISLNMTDVNDLHWENATLPPQIESRANAELIWEKADPGLMATISIYDIGNNTWSNTTGDIPRSARTMFCSVLCSAADGSSHNIYIYGGYDGQDAEQSPYDDVYVLSLPSFIWIKVYSGNQRHGRSGHRCFRVFPDQMLVVGGLYRDPSVCLDKGMIRSYNLNELQFQDSYSPSSWEDYKVPSAIRHKIGGSDRGHANRTGPDVWNDPNLSTLFHTPYLRSQATWYPYNTSSIGRKSQDPGSGQENSSKGSSWKIGIGVGISVPIAMTFTSIFLIWVKRSDPGFLSLRNLLHRQLLGLVGITHGLTSMFKHHQAMEADELDAQSRYSKTRTSWDGTHEEALGPQLSYSVTPPEMRADQIRYH
ncbi:hypothetical protein N7492_009783 [Penicillium capsulatum]|uniref:Kelch repeat protein n=1 Tax=Penicillium capsulatum TaxID=69766 RepID=A0A9W9HPC2_9EURO|nr:hypothetical protein N7492_009783 [Penicillium capsulatum]KAJ6114135.1 hypothetical protein N7512_007580 [Penicillium capsulatum]